MPVQEVKCSLCRKRVKVHDQYDIPIFDPNTGFAICKNCIREIGRFLDEHDAAKGQVVNQPQKSNFAVELGEVLKKNKPHVIKAYLDEFIIKQERAKKILSVAAYNHYKRMLYDYEHGGGEDEIDKSNVIIMGPTGCGKTALLSHLSRLLDIPFAVTDASSLTEA